MHVASGYECRPEGLWFIWCGSMLAVADHFKSVHAPEVSEVHGEDRKLYAPGQGATGASMTRAGRRFAREPTLVRMRRTANKSGAVSSEGRSCSRSRPYREGAHVIAAWIAVGMAVSLACETEGANRGQRTGGDVMRYDSAGVAIVSHENGWRATVESWKLSEHPVLGSAWIRRSAATICTAWVVGGVILSDGVAIADRASDEIRFFDMSGALTRRVGGRGGGPEEFRSLIWLGRSPSGVAAMDRLTSTLVQFAPDGELLRRDLLMVRLSALFVPRSLHAAFYHNMWMRNGRSG